MKSWNRPEVPALPGTGIIPRIWDTASGGVVEARPRGTAGLYVCGITPYDATHLGHAATYLAYDGLIRLWLDAGYTVKYVQNITDVDDPLLERAIATGVDWRDLAAGQIELFRGDMEALSIVPPDCYTGVTEMVEPTAAAVKKLVDRGIGYYVDDDIYFDSALASAAAPWYLGFESRLDREIMLELSAQRGGDPDRAGKRDPLDPVLWRAARDGEPSWSTVLGDGRPGWHIECSVIAQANLELPMTVQGGGSDLLFPHHEFSAGHTAALTGRHLADTYSHTAMVAFEGEKMSKSLGNLVLVSTLTNDGVDPRALRLALLAQHYRTDWEWTDDLLTAGAERLARWTAWAAASASRPLGDASEATGGDAEAKPTELLAQLREALSDDLDFPAALTLIDAAIAGGVVATPVDAAAIDALLGVRL